MIEQNRLHVLVPICLFLLILSVGASDSAGQSPDSSNVTADSLQTHSEVRALGGFEVGYSSRTDDFHGLFFRLFYEAEFGRIFLNAGAFSYQRINDGFGFDFRVRFPAIFYPSGASNNFAPDIGLSCTVWPDYKSTVSIGFPIGLEYEFIIDGFPNLSARAYAAPLVNLSAIKNTFIFGAAIGIRFD